MVFVDANQKKTFTDELWPAPCITAVNGDLNWAEHTGLAAVQKLSSDEWAAVMKGQEDP